MKKLQKDFTTPEQSRRLLELGVPAWTANLYFYEEGCISNNDEPSGVIPYDEVYEDNSKETMFSSFVELPCWSVGRLMEIFAICFDPDFIHFDTYTDGINFLQQMMDKFETYAENMDFSKLEE